MPLFVAVEETFFRFSPDVSDAGQRRLVDSVDGDAGVFALGGGVVVVGAGGTAGAGRHGRFPAADRRQAHRAMALDLAVGGAGAGALAGGAGGHH